MNEKVTTIYGRQFTWHKHSIQHQKWLNTIKKDADKDIKTMHEGLNAGADKWTHSNARNLLFMNIILQ